MKRAIWLIMVVFFAAGLLFFAGCGGSKTSSSGTKGKVTEASLGVPIYPGATEQDVTNGMPARGSGTNGPPPYGGQSGTSAFQPPGNQSGTNGQNPMPGPRSGNMTMLWTPDSTSKVAAWYKERLSGRTRFAEVTLPGPQGSDQGTASVMYTFKSGDSTKTVMIRENNMDDKGGTNITIGDLPEGLPAAPPVNQSQQQ